MADDSDFDDRVPMQDEDEADDMLTGEGKPNAGEDDYECPEEDEEYAEEEPAASEGANDPEASAKHTNDAYVLSNKVAYLVPYAGSDMKGQGRIRDYEDVITVENETVLSQMKNPKSWPEPKDIPSQAIVVIKGRHAEADELAAGKENGPFGWYARVVHKGNPNGPDRKILRLIPKAVVKGLKTYLAKHPHYNRTSLITDYQPEYDNAKEFPVSINGWKECRTLKSEAAPPKRTPKEPEPKKRALFRERQDYAGVLAGVIGVCRDEEHSEYPSVSLDECMKDRVSKRIRDEMSERALAVGLAESKRWRDEKLIDAVLSMARARDDLKDEVEKAEHEIEEARTAEDEHAISMYATYTRRKRAANRTKHWKTVKERQLDSEGHFACAICGFWDHRDTSLQMSDTTLRLDHIIALELDGADDDPDNLQILCGNCDNRKTESDNKLYRAKLAKKRQDAKLVGLVFRPKLPPSD